MATATGVAPLIKVGDMAPDFTLKDQDQKDVTLSSFRGRKNVVLAFGLLSAGLEPGVHG